MSESQLAWYQKGCTVSCVAVVLLLASLFYLEWEESQKPEVVPMLSVVVTTPLLFGTSSLDLNVWHQHTEVLRNGRLRVALLHQPGENESDRLDEDLYSLRTLGTQ